MWKRLLAEPPFRLLAKALCRWLPVRVELKSWWDATDRPHYLAGVLYSALQAKEAGLHSIAAVEFGVAEGAGLVALQGHAAAVERATGVQVKVYGFDSGVGMPHGTGDYRDHPDVWLPGDYVMNVSALQAKLAGRTTLILGDVAQTVWSAPIPEPLGFVAMDLDYYSSTLAALGILRRFAGQGGLPRVALYFDDLSAHYNHAFAGELLAIQQFNLEQMDVKIDRWRGLHERPFHDAPWLRCMYLAHDLRAIEATQLRRGPARMGRQ